jgi:hypothetical protein
MALAIDPEKKSIKYGAAAELLFGVPESDDFDVLESSSQTASYGTDVQVKNEVGITVGQLLGDPKVEVTLTGMGSKAPKALGALTEMFTQVAGVAENGTGQPSAENLQFCIKQVKADFANEDFVKFEVSGEHYFNVTYSNSKSIGRGDDEHPA